MKTTFKNLTLSLAAAVIAGPALFGASAMAGGDYYGGGLKGMRGSHVPVPAPVPVPEYKPRWYMRFDAGVGLGVGLDTSESGMTYGERDAAGGSSGIAENGPFGMPSSADTGGDVGHSIGIGAGYYFSNNFRMDVTGELRMEKSSTLDGSFEYDSVNPPGGIFPGAPDGYRVFGEVSDKTTMKSGIFMANGYYDFSRSSKFVPYVGGGIGFAVNEIERTHTTALASCDRSVDPTCQPPLNTAYRAASDTEYTYSLAANAQAGFSYRLSDITSLDFNYRYLYVGGSDTSLTINGYRSKVEIEDQHEHYLRAGLRFDIN